MDDIIPYFAKRYMTFSAISEKEYDIFIKRYIEPRKRNAESESLPSSTQNKRQCIG